MPGAAPFESAASELVDESKHPVEQLEILDEKAADMESLGDNDAVVECRIKQLSLQRLLVHLYDFPLQPLIRSQAVLAEAYAAGRFFKQAHEHLANAREASLGGVYDDVQCQRLQVDLLIAEGVVSLAEAEEMMPRETAMPHEVPDSSGGPRAFKAKKEHLDAAQKSLEEAARVSRGVYGEMDIRAARIHSMLGRIAQHRGRCSEAIDHFSSAWCVYDYAETTDGENTIKMRLRIAEAYNQDGQTEKAIDELAMVVKRMEESNVLPMVLVESLAQLARWYEAKGRDPEALAALQKAEMTVTENCGPEDAKAVDIKRDVALLHLKLSNHDTALRYLNDVHYLERRHHGSQSTNVARTLKALGTVHIVRRNLEEAEECLLGALRIFEADHVAHSGIIRDIHEKLRSLGRLASVPES